MTAGFSLLFSTCSKDDPARTFTSQVDLRGTSVAADQINTFLLFSTDNGKTFVRAPLLQVGQSFQVKIMDNTAGIPLNAANFFSADWSSSDPAPDNATSDTPQFTFSTTTKLSAKVVDLHCPFKSASWIGKWGGDEVGACCSGTDKNNIRVDASNPNKFIMDNFWGDGVDAYFLMKTSTTAYDQVVTIPTQTTSEGGVASGTGTYDQCRGTFTINTTYVIGGDTYNWQYNFHR